MRTFILSILACFCCIAASADNAEKLYKQGKALYDAENYTAAVPKLRAAADLGHKKAQYRLGRCYDKGRGVEENNQEAFRWYAKSAAQGYAKAEYHLGRCYHKGKGTEKDMEKAVFYYAKAVKQDNAEAQLALGKCYLKGKGVAVDKKKARSLVSKAVHNPKGGDELLKELRQEAADGDEDAIAVLGLL